MTPEKFFDYLEGKLPPAEKERLERALIGDPELQQQFFQARQIHRGMQRPADENPVTRRAGHRGRQLAAAFAVLVALNVFLGLYYIFWSNKPSTEVRKAREDTLRHQLQSSLEKSAAAAFPPPTLGPEAVSITVPRDKQDEVAQAIITAATKAGGSGTKDLPNDKGVKVLVLVPGSAERQFRHTLITMGAPVTASSDAAPNDPVNLEVVLTNPR